MEEYEYRFCVAGLTHEECVGLFAPIVQYVDAHGGWIGGGFHPLADGEDTPWVDEEVSDEEYQFDFCVSGLTHEGCVNLFALIVQYVDECGGLVGGGFHPLAANKEVDDGEAQ